MFLNRQFIIMSQWALNSISSHLSSSLSCCVIRGLAEECQLLKVTVESPFGNKVQTGIRRCDKDFVVMFSASYLMYLWREISL